MTGLCMLAGAALLAAYPLSDFTLAWTHSVERIAWEEDWHVTPEGLRLEQARVKGSGAGMDPGEDARFDGEWWRWAPRVPSLPELMLARSGATGEAWRLCTPEGCEALPEGGGGAPVLTLKPCPVEDGASPDR